MTKISSTDDLRRRLVYEALSIPAGCFKQVFLDETKELSFSSPMRGPEWVSSQNTIGFLDSLQSEYEDYETNAAMVKAALEEGWFGSIVNSYLLSSDESVTVFR
jgi:hypothetical protein